MKIVNIDQTPKTPAFSPLFTGPEVTRQSLTPGSEQHSINLVRFGKAVRNKFHTHTHEQVLIVTSGEGIVATDKEEKVVRVGDLILIAAGEKHWHGATKQSEFAHISLMHPDNTTTQIEF